MPDLARSGKMTYLARSGRVWHIQKLISPFYFFSAAEIHKSELFWQDLGEYGRFCQIVSMEMRKTCFCPRNIENKLK
jgi:hypothetical protein